jgi:hypothetical protein
MIAEIVSALGQLMRSEMYFFHMSPNAVITFDLSVRETGFVVPSRLARR